MKVLRQGGKKTIYGWERDGGFFLSVFASGHNPRPANRYESRDEAEAEAERRNCVIEWNDSDGD